MHNDQTSISDSLKERDPEMTEGVAFRIDQHQQAMIDNLDGIIREAARLRDDLCSADGAVAMGAARSIDDSAGASGPIHSKYARVIREAARLCAIVEVTR